MDVRHYSTINLSNNGTDHPVYAKHNQKLLYHIISMNLMLNHHIACYKWRGSAGNRDGDSCPLRP